MLHELVHIVQGPHDAKFYSLLDELWSEYELGLQDGRLPDGARLGGAVVSEERVRQIRLEAAEKRGWLNRIMIPTGGRKLGGAILSGTRKPSPQELKMLAVAAAEQRARDSKWCGNHDEDEGLDAGPSVEAGRHASNTPPRREAPHTSVPPGKRRRHKRDPSALVIDLTDTPQPEAGPAKADEVVEKRLRFLFFRNKMHFRSLKACDLCAKKKIKCLVHPHEGSEAVCEACFQRGQFCTWTIPTKKRGPKSKAQKLEMEFASLELETPGDLGKPMPGILAAGSQLSTPSPEASGSTRDGSNSGGVEQIPLTGETAVFSYRPCDVMEWTSFTFFTTQFLDPDGTVYTFSDYYSKWVYKEIPVLPGQWLDNHFFDLPLYMLHIMYAMCLILPERKGMSIGAGLPHLLYAWNFIKLQVAAADPFMLCAMMHIIDVAAECKVLEIAQDAHATAVEMAKLLQLAEGGTKVWVSPLGNMFDVTSFCKVMYISLYSMDFECCLITDNDLFIEKELPAEYYSTDLALLETLDGQHTEHALSYYQYYLPLVNIARNIFQCTRKRSQMPAEPSLQAFSFSASTDIKEEVDHLSRLDCWYYRLPLHLKFAVNDRSWPGRYVAQLNMLYHYTRLLALKSNLKTQLGQ
ncbi:hypothetical protein HDU91_007058, partial [Kappamyces sp. JEL0680]